MYLGHISLHKLKLMDSIELSFTNHEDWVDEHGQHHARDEPRMWTVLIGRNGRGKSKTFPRIQLVATTHSPLVLSCLRPEEIVVMTLNERGDLEARHGEHGQDPRLRTTSELARASFEIDTLYPQTLGAKRDEYSAIAVNRYRTPAQAARALELLDELRRHGIHPEALRGSQRHPLAHGGSPSGG